MSLLDKLQKNSTIKLTGTLDNSTIFNKKDMISTPIPMLNVALSGKMDGGLTPGLTVLAGPSKHFKTAFTLIMAAAYLNKYEDGVVLFYDTEFGAPPPYFKVFGVDTSRVVHTPITDVEELKHDIMKQLKSIDRGDKVCIIIDSIGNIASKKEVDDAVEGKSVADMSRAKALKSLFRMVTPHLSLKDLPMIVVNHTYKEIGLFPKDVVSGGTGVYYSADNIWIIGRQQEKEGTDITGYNFIINIEKSRFVREKSKIPINVTWEGGIEKWSGLLDISIQGKFILSEQKGWYQSVDGDGVVQDNKMRRKDFEYDDEFWQRMLEQTQLKTYIENKYSIPNN